MADEDDEVFCKEETKDRGDLKSKKKRKLSQKLALKMLEKEAGEIEGDTVQEGTADANSLQEGTAEADFSV